MGSTQGRRDLGVRMTYGPRCAVAALVGLGGVKGFKEAQADNET